MPGRARPERLADAVRYYLGVMDRHNDGSNQRRSGA